MLRNTLGTPWESDENIARTKTKKHPCSQSLLLTLTPYPTHANHWQVCNDTIVHNVFIIISRASSSPTRDIHTFEGETTNPKEKKKTVFSLCAVHIDCKENCITLFLPGKEKQEGQIVSQNQASKQQERPERDFKTDLQQNCTSPPLQSFVCCLRTLCLPVLLSLRTKVSYCGHRRRLQARSTVPPPDLSCDVRKCQHQHQQRLHPQQSLRRSCAYPHAVDQFWPDDPRTARDITAR